MTSVWNYLWIAYAAVVPINYGLKAWRRKWERKLAALKAELAYLDEGHKYHPWFISEQPFVNADLGGEKYMRPLALWDSYDMVADISKTTIN